MSGRRFAIVAFLLAAALLAAGAVAEAADPQFNRVVRIIVPYAPGGSSDILARLIGPHLSKAIGQPVVVENKVGCLRKHRRRLRSQGRKKTATPC